MIAQCLWVGSCREAFVGQAHPREQLAAFQAGGETALVYARRKADQSIWYLEDGTASRAGLREWVAEELECFLPECPDRRLRLVNRHTSVRIARDGFAHRPGAGCNPTPESLWHQQGKAAVVAWVRTHRPNLTVETEVVLGGGVRRPDVLISSPDGSRRVAIEIQYAALGVKALEERTRSYAELGVPVQWLWGHSGKHFKVASDAASWVVLNDAHRAVLKSGGSVLWLNPLANLLATPFVVSRLPSARGSWRTPPSAQATFAEVEVEPFGGGVTLDPARGFVTCAQAQIEKEERWFEEARARHAAARQKRENQRRSEERPAIPWESEEDFRRRTRHIEQALQREQRKAAKAMDRREARQRADRDIVGLDEWMTPERQARLDDVLAKNKEGWRAAMATGQPVAGPEFPPQPKAPSAPSRPTVRAAARPMRVDPTKRPCPTCGLPVDSILRSGYHLGCEPPESSRADATPPLPAEEPEPGLW